jgi:T5SS/PEP-CTERM-associated repeat protein
MVLLVLLAALPAMAEDDTSVSITTNYNNAKGYWVVGETGTNNSLTISGGGVLTNVGKSYIGSNGTAGANWAVVTGPNSAWYSSNNLQVGNYGAGNSLLITNGGLVRNQVGFVGMYSNANSVVVTDPNSAWRNGGSIYVGYQGAENRVRVANGGLLTSTNLFGNGSVIGYDTGGDSNSVAVDGAGSIWSNVGTLYIGDVGNASWNSLLVTNGGAMRNSNTAYVSSSATSSNNSVIVTGTGSVWSVGFVLYLGRSGSGNSMSVADGGVISVVDTLYLGDAATCSNNVITVAGAGSVLSNKTLYVGNSGVGNLLMISNGGKVYSSMTLGSGVLGSSATGLRNSAIITGADSAWYVSNLTVGFAGGGNTLSILDGGAVSSINGTLGRSGTSGTNNWVIVSGAGSTWSNSGSLVVGSASSRNTVLVTNGGSVSCGVGLIGVNGGINNSVIVTGTGSTWRISGGLTNGAYAPAGGAFSRVTVADAGEVSADSALLGMDANSTGNALTITGGAFSTTNASKTGSLEVRRGTLTLNGGTLWTDRLVATNSGASAFTFSKGTLDSASTVISNGSVFAVGNGSSAATLRLEGGTHVFQNGARIMSNSTLRGTGLASRVSIAAGGMLAPGFSPGALSVSNLTFEAGGAQMGFEIADEFSYDQVFAGSLTVQGNVAWSLGFTDHAVTSMVALTLMDVGVYGGATTSGWLSLGGTNLLADGAVFALDDAYSSTAYYRISYFGGDGNDVTLTTASPVPEPSSLLAVGAGLALAGLLRRKASARMAQAKGTP